MTTVLAPRTNTELVFGNSQELQQFAARIKMMMRGGDKLTGPEALALAQFAKVTNLNPFIGECWYISGSGPMVGIAGARRLDQEDTTNRGGYSTVNTIPCSPEDAGALEAELKDVVAAFRAEISDSQATLEYQKMFSAALASLREAGVPDPVPAAREICGPRPSWVGYGYSTKGERSRMNKTQLARKRAEADALKRKIVIPFGAQIAETDTAPEYIDAEAKVEDVKPRRSQEQNLAELGYTPTPQAPEPDVDKTFPPDPEAIYQESKVRRMKMKGVDTAFGDMTKDQLLWVVNNAKIQANADAAAIVLQHDHGVKPEPTSGPTIPEGQLL
jgi:hypothetical protein